ncbi:MAG TPA: hypothetical protein DD979_12155 [Gammaproteobacteria bacterium]|jgi:flagellar basal-body rod modification protein FlgD|nr:hypothetical protein [Gammaproteobacteria bacterium]
MTTPISSSDVVNNYAFSTSSVPTKKNELGQNEFMTLMLEQLRNQDPMQPQENGEFIAQMAQFSTVTGIDGMQKSIDALATSLGTYQVMQSANLVGHEVLVPSNKFALNADNTLNAVYDADASASNAVATIYGSNGELVHEIDLGLQNAGRNSFTWDGTLENGERAAPDTYTITVSYGSGENTAVGDVSVKQEIESVNISTSDGEIILNTVDGQTLKLSQVSQIH